MCQHIVQELGNFRFTGEFRKDHCAWCFLTSFNEQGIYFCFKCKSAYCDTDSSKSHLDEHSAKYNHNVFLHLRNQKVFEEWNEITKLAINTQGGFNDQKVQSSYHLFCKECNIKVDPLSINQQQLIQSFEHCQSVEYQIQKSVWEEQLRSCLHSSNVKHEIQKQIQEKKCSQCNLETNLWLCLICGNLGCGRKFYDGSGGNGHGIEHFELTKHPVSVKLGTLSENEKPSIFCYTCQEDVSVPNIIELVQQLGIETKGLAKNEKTMVEMSIEANKLIELSKDYEKDQQLQLIQNFSHIGIKNLGNTCYANSLLQFLSKSQGFQQLLQGGQHHINGCQKQLKDCLSCQIAIIFNSLNNPYDNLERTIVPYDFLRLVVQNSHQFQTHQQQDPFEYLQILFNKIGQLGYNQNENMLKNFRYESCQIFTCSNCPFSISKKRAGLILEIYLDDQMIQLALKTKQINFQEIFINGIKAQDIVEHCTNCQKKNVFVGKEYMSVFPSDLILKLQRIEFVKGIPTKLDYKININLNEINLSQFDVWSHSQQQILSQNLWQENQDHESQIQELVSMGFDKKICQFALQQTKGDTEQALNLILNNLDNPNFGISQSKDNKLFEQVWDIAESFGTEKQYVQKVCEKYQNQGIEEIINYILETPNDVGQLESVNPTLYDDGKRNYQVQSSIVHLGASINTGHYVPYIKDQKHQDQWVYLNDDQCYHTTQPKVEDSYMILLSKTN